MDNWPEAMTGLGLVLAHLGLIWYALHVIGTLGSALGINRILREATMDLNTSADQVSSAAAQVSSSAQSLA